VLVNEERLLAERLNQVQLQGRSLSLAVGRSARSAAVITWKLTLMDNPKRQPNLRRRLALVALTAVFIVAGAAARSGVVRRPLAHEHRRCYVQGNLVQLTHRSPASSFASTPTIPPWYRGRPVVVLDDADTRTALDEAKAGLAQAVRRVRQLYANTEALRASVELRRAEWRRAPGLREAGLRLVERSPGIGVVEHDDRVALAYQGGIVGVDANDDAGDLWRKLHQIALDIGIVGARVPAAFEPPPERGGGARDDEHCGERDERKASSEIGLSFGVVH